MSDELWTPSDSLLMQDKLAESLVNSPSSSFHIDGVGDEDDEANAQRAASVLAEGKQDIPVDGVDGSAQDDDEVDPDDPDGDVISAEI